MTTKQLNRLRSQFLCLTLLAGTTAQLAAQASLNSYDLIGNTVAANPTTVTLPVILAHPQPQLLRPNGIATFSVLAQGVGFGYQWRSNGVPIAGATGDSLVLAGLPLVGTNLGNFTVIVSNTSGSVTSNPAALWPDANANDLPDWWEIARFGNLNQTASGDFDRDGIANLDEFAEDTNPNSASSFNPRLRIVSRHGSVSVSPIQPYYSLGQIVNLNAVPEPGHQFTSYSGSFNGTKAQISLLMDTNKSITATFGLPLPVALDNANLLWITGGDLPWYGQAEISKDGVGAGQSGPIVAYWNGGTFVGAQSWLRTTVNIPETTLLSFWWNVSSRPPDALTFALDGFVLASISGEAVGWQQVQTNLIAGFHTLTWTYTKGPADIPTGVLFADSGWLDQVSLTVTNGGILSPILSIMTTTTNTVLISWPAPSTGFALQQTSTLSPTDWVEVTNSVDSVGGRNQVLITPATSGRFYRLLHP
jgi:hypothetical protein